MIQGNLGGFSKEETDLLQRQVHELLLSLCELSPFSFLCEAPDHEL
jgi:hypothetical protein